jgi:hypothetical protein
MKQANKLTKRAARAFTIQDAEAIAELTAKGLNESEACSRLQLKKESWFNWKHRNPDKSGELITRIRANRLANLLGEIETAAKGDAERGIRHDWRAADRLLAISAPERFGKSQETAPPAPVVNIAVLDSLSRLVYSVDSPPAQPIALPANTPDSPA